MNEITVGRCAVHPDKPLSITCHYCGSFACTDCTVDKLWGQTLCVACDARGVASYPLAWDRAPGLPQFARTIRSVVMETRLVFNEFPRGSVARAFGFAAAMGMLWMLPMSLGIVRRPAHEPQAMPVPLMLLTLAMTYGTWTVAPGLTFYFAQLILRGQASLATCLRVSAYLTALIVLFCVASFLPLPIALILSAGQLALFVWAWVLFARARAALSLRRAVLAVGLACCVSFLAVLIVAALPGELYTAFAAGSP